MKIINRYRILIVFVNVVICCTGCASKEQPSWSDSMIGYNHSLSQGAKQETVISVIDFDEPVTAEDSSTTISHLELMTSIINNMAPNAKIIPKPLNESTAVALAEAIDNSVEEDVDIISLSLGISEDHPRLRQSISSAIEKGLLVICAAGNNYDDLLYPAMYESTISCLARDIQERDAYKNFQKITKKSFSAPGVHVSINGKRYSGSSISTAIITSQFALACSISHNKSDIVAHAIATAENGSKYSYGVIQTDALMHVISET